MVRHVTTLCWIIFIWGFTDIDAKKEITAREKNDNLILICPFEKCEWNLDGIALENTSKELDIGSVWNDPRGIYSCKSKGTEDEEVFIDVFVRKCQNCIELDAGTVTGFIIADIIMIGLISMAVYFVSGSETRRPNRASDKMNLIETEQYETLRKHQSETYNQLAPRTKRNAV
ncbi:T-cell surface glycoprotein CD3 gamma chain-like [Pyxicephalus adspersus]